jgi:predicted metalloprotease with PDZ domain
MILAARAGLWTPDEFRDALSDMAANMDHTSGREWRPLADTAIGAPVAYGSPRHWRAYRRSTDFYIEGPLIWLEVDTIIRRQTGGRSSLDDFCRRFFGGEGGGPALKPYTFQEVVGTLNSVAPFEWGDFFQRRIDSVTPNAPLEGIEASGWKLVYNDKPNIDVTDREELNKATDLTYSLGLRLNEAGEIDDVIPGLAADRAGLSPGMKLIAVNGRKWSPNVLRIAVSAAQTASGRLELLAENADFYKSHSLDYRGGLRYPHLERDASKPDVLAEIIGPLATRKQ